MIATAVLAGCGEQVAAPPAENRSVEVKTSRPEAPAPRGVFTSLASGDCAVLERVTEEAGWLRERCPGPPGWSLERTEGDLRQNLIVEREGGEDNLGLPGMAGGGGFSALGARAEWRYPAGAETPRTLTVRFNVQENEPPAPDISYLLVTRLEAPACVVAVVPPGPEQSARARAIADARRLPACLPKPA